MALFLLHSQMLAYCFIGSNTLLLYFCYMSEENVQMNLKVPSSLRDKLRDAAAANHRSMTAELIARVTESFDDEPLAERVGELEEQVCSLEEKVERIDIFLSRNNPMGW